MFFALLRERRRLNRCPEKHTSVKEKANPVVIVQFRKQHIDRVIQFAQIPMLLNQQPTDGLVRKKLQECINLLH